MKTLACWSTRHTYRSAHSNAYFYGFWKNKRIVLFDTLLEEGLMPKKEGEKNETMKEEGEGKETMKEEGEESKEEGEGNKEKEGEGEEGPKEGGVQEKKKV